MRLAVRRPFRYQQNAKHRDPCSTARPRGSRLQSLAAAELPTISGGTTMHRPRLHDLALATALCAAVGLTTSVAAHAASAGDTLLTSEMPIPAGAIASSGSGVDSDGEPATTSVSANGRYVAFLSDEDDLTPGIEPDATNVFRKDRTTGAVELISRTTGAGGTGLAAVVRAPVISNDGNRIAFTSDGAFDPADADGLSDVYVRDIAAGTTTLATPGTTTSIFGFDLSGDGNWVAFSTTDVLGAATDANGQSDVYRRNLTTGAVTLASGVDGTTTAGNQGSDQPSISDDGNWVAFASRATNLVPGFVSSGQTNIFARRMSSNLTVLISAKFNSSVTGGNADSSGPIVAGQPTTTASLRVGYTSRATDLADNATSDSSSNDSTYVRQFAVNASVLASRTTGAGGANANSSAYLTSLSDDGQRAAFTSTSSNLPGADATNAFRTYVRNLGDSTTTRVSGASSYAVSGALSGDGSFVAWFESGATAAFDPGLSGVFGRTVPSGPIELVSRPPGSAPLAAAAPTIQLPESGVRRVSADGRYVVFAGAGAGLGVSSSAGIDDQVYRRDLQTKELQLVSRATGENGAVADRYAGDPSIDAAGGRVAFLTSAALDPADTNPNTDVYVRDLVAGTTTLVSRANGADGAVSNGQVSNPSISADGKRVAFRSTSSSFGVADGKGHIYVRDLAASTTVLADRATGAAGAASNDGGDAPRLSGDGRLVVFASRSTNLSPDDPSGPSNDIYLRDLTTDVTTLLSRRPGLAGTKATGSSSAPSISSDGSTVAFATSDELVAPAAGPWGSADQVVARTVATGQNTIVSRSTSGSVADRDASSPSVNADGTVIAFSSDATNLLPGRGGSNRDAVFAKNLTTGELSGPPAFGLALDWAQQRATYPSISEDGQCMAFNANGHNAITGKAGDFRSAYLYVVSGACPKPLPATPTPVPTPAPTLLVPALSGASMTNARFKIGRGTTPLTAAGATAAPRKRTPTGTAFRFTLSTKADVRIRILRRTAGRRVGGQCLAATPKRAKRKRCDRYVAVNALVRTGLPSGANTVAFSGRLGKRKLPLGAYRAELVASAAGGSSKPVTLTFTIVRR